MGEGWLGARKNATNGCQAEVERQARDGWRLVQIFTPGIGAYGSAKYEELVLERAVAG
jgi:hypothetical protein